MAKPPKTTHPFIAKLQRNQLRRTTMKDFKLDHAYLLRDVDDSLFKKSPRNLTDFLIRQALASKYKEGIKNRSDQRHASKIQNALTVALKDEKDSVSLTSDQIHWLYDALKDWSAPVAGASWFIELLDYVEGLIRELESAEKTVKTAG
jgi:hypothetical protein